MSWLVFSKRKKILKEFARLNEIIEKLNFLLASLNEMGNNNDDEINSVELNLKSAINVLINKISYKLFNRETLIQEGFIVNKEFASTELQNNSLYNKDNGFIPTLQKINANLNNLFNNLLNIRKLIRNNTHISDDLISKHKQLMSKLKTIIVSILDDLNDAVSGQNPILCGIFMNKKGKKLGKSKLKKLTVSAALVASLAGVGMKMNMIRPAVGYSAVMQTYMEHLKEKKLSPDILRLAQLHGIEVHFFPGTRQMIVYDAVTGYSLIELTARGGPQERYKDNVNPGHSYGPTHSGKFIILRDNISPYVKRDSSWNYARIKFGASIRENNDQIEVSENEGKTWFFVTGPKAKVNGLKKSDFYIGGVLLSKWYLNPFGHLAIEYKNENEKVSPEKIHTNILGEFTQLAPKDIGNLMQPISHGCIHMSPSDIEVLKDIIFISKKGDIFFIVHRYNNYPNA
ncbi:hypothetical protein J4440_02940 [Candidatus Woesearchaeota archaeon]|nr:hypothetical protein [Candidatus Woesearchaeota archaeon]